MLYNLFTGKKWNAGTITGWAADAYAGVGKAQEASKKYSDTFNNLNKQFQGLKDVEAELDKIKLDRALSKMLPQQQIQELQKRINAVNAKQKSFTDTAKQAEEEWSKARKVVNNTPIGSKERTEAEEKANSLYKKLLGIRKQFNAQLQEKYKLEDKQAEKYKELISIQNEYLSSMDGIRERYLKLFETFSWGFKDGKFGQWTEQARQNTLQAELNAQKEKLSSLYGKTDVDSLKQRKSILEKIMDIQTEQGKAQLDSLNKQREAAISGLKEMQKLLNDATNLRTTSQQGIEAGSMEALRLQSREQDSKLKIDLQPMVEQQKQVKDIETRMLQQQRSSLLTLEKINTSIRLVIDKIKTGSSGGGTGSNVIPVNPGI